MAVTWAATPAVRALALRLGWLDAPSSSVKTHKVATPSLGGMAIYLGYAAALLLTRYWTRFPTGTLHALRALLLGGTLVFFCGIVDDLRKPHGLGFKEKFAAQAAAAILLIHFGVRIRFIRPDYISQALTLLWVVGITNAYNIIDIMDGLAASQAAIAALAFLLISLPSEELYVNIAASALAGAALGFLPWNLSKKRKIFMGDSGSLLLGFLLSGLAMGTKYTVVNNLGVYCPLLILLVPMYDTLFVMVLRLRKGQSPFLGSKDHFALRLERLGYPRSTIILMAAAASIFLGFCAFLVTQFTWKWALGVYVVVLAEILLLSKALAEIVMHD
ncbi:MAG: undecaprenyl/decaprenyl-phosphate alpha-N-acetylglucosaminyl 1-phosphate transferase [Elusimicrobia bacterium]|nr:undecaprenyl/decaprenyl-phosphate alpha-N-acetylglucosaminyl 1-phosphate transferase [Elusimicrobiota bacterium]MDE2237340.1 undecaprenyl/decaprenyl-phosphate alpha-N-acetylglucosaminyl 1-phosphate transferase [Elusimicrobiota bacterium]MDE2424316.1 undecaprenyl/decaprenyl-phosphate alpha-N-acetylglucosaminyl 1-phosphate transferase [Elusimicrobiota bacterium]